MTTSISKSFAMMILISSALTACQKEMLNEPGKDVLISSPVNRDNINNSKKERTILFTSYRDDSNGEIYAMNTDGSNITRLTFDNIQDGRASWASNYQHIAFASGPANNRDIFVMNANGNGRRNISNSYGADEDWPEWAPQGNHVIYSSNRDGNHEIYLYNSDNETSTRLTNRTQDDKWPTYSPDGSKIAFQSNLGSGSGLTEIFIMNADGTNILRLTNSPALDQMPTWSPDGNKIAFMSSRDGNPEIYVMNADGSAQTRLTNFPGIDARPCWSKETGLIAFTSTRDFPTTALTNYEIYIMNGDGSNPVRLTSNSIYDDYPFIK